MRRLDTLPIQVNLAAVDRGGGQAARFEKPRMPKPFIEAMVIGFFFGCHK
jgi:hypothetical protein